MGRSNQRRVAVYQLAQCGHAPHRLEQGIHQVAAWNFDLRNSLSAGTVTARLVRVRV